MSRSCAESATADLDQRINAANQFLGEPISWQRMGLEGTSNQLFRAVVNGRSLVLRLNADSQQAFGVVRATEAAVLDAIQPYPWAPTIIHNPWPQQWCLMLDHGEQVVPPGQAQVSHELPDDDSGSSSRQCPDFSDKVSGIYTDKASGRSLSTTADELLVAVAEWQGIEQGPAFNYAVLFANYRQALEGAHPGWGALQDRLEESFSRLPAVPCCLTHQDLHWGNLCRDGERLVVVDWEYAGIGNPWLDAGALYRLFALSPAELAELPAFRALDPQRFSQGLAVSVWLNEALSCLWYGVRTAGSVEQELWQQEAERLLQVPLAGDRLGL